MKKMLNAVLGGIVVACLLPTVAQANPQHERMRRCNAEAKEQALKGEERKAFMSTCLRGKHASGAAQAQPAEAPQSAVPAGEGKTVAEAGKAERLQACSLAAAEQSLSGAQRKAFIAECSQG